MIGCWLTPPEAMGANVTVGTGTSSPNRADDGRPSAVRRCGLASVRLVPSVLISR